MQSDSQSGRHLEPSRSLSLQYKQTLIHNGKHNYCFKCIRIFPSSPITFRDSKTRLVVTLTSTQSFKTQFHNHHLEFGIMQKKKY